MTQDPAATTTGSGTPGPGGLTHVDETGAARMVDVSAKDTSVRRAVASGKVLVSAEVVAALRGDGVPKGDALGVARIAGIMGAKRTPDLVPLCHPIAITGAKVDLKVADNAVLIQAQVKTTDRTGVEMEALDRGRRRRAGRDRHGEGAGSCCGADRRTGGAERRR